ncbi:hypothetical protein [Streptomyces echinatus]|uniref:Uncharacterized protein n=1 Tax=Streptomyces echinatus TaxID=67293 RepID=A0A7W9Q392_9ACTN|nr:hypothetical protein [Streptomyces echinatus]MBB5932338.1 hypothetical protein [Streptomyces echinatus]
MASQEYMRRWQRAAHQALGEFLKADLPAVSWSIPVSGALVGDVDSLTSTPDEQRAAFAAWTQYLGADVMPERTDSGGVTRLYAKFWRQGDRDGVRGAIRASIYPPMDDEVQS